MKLLSFLVFAFPTTILGVWHVIDNPSLENHNEHLAKENLIVESVLLHVDEVKNSEGEICKHYTIDHVIYRVDESDQRWFHSKGHVIISSCSDDEIYGENDPNCHSVQIDNRFISNDESFAEHGVCFVNFVTENEVHNQIVIKSEREILERL